MRTSRLVLLALVPLLLAGSLAAQELDPAPPADFVRVDELVELPAFIPGVGTLYVRPDDAPLGPWLAYGSDGTLVEVLFMISVADIQAAEEWTDLARDLLATVGGVVDHVDITYTGGHPGLAEPHYHVRLVLVAPDVQEGALAE